MKFCKQCGTLYDETLNDCPKCTASQIQERAEQTETAEMSPEQAQKAKKKAWIEIIIGVPALIGIIYLLIYLMQIIKG